MREFRFVRCPDCNGYGIKDCGAGCRKCGGGPDSQRGHGKMGSGEVILDAKTGAQVSLAEFNAEIAKGT